MSKSKIAGLIILALICLGVVTFAAGGFNLLYYKVFAPRYEDVRRDVFENTQSYIHGKITDLAKIKWEYDNSTSKVARKALQQRVLHDFAEFPADKIKEPALKRWLVSMRGY